MTPLEGWPAHLFLHAGGIRWCLWTDDELAKHHKVNQARKLGAEVPEGQLEFYRSDYQC